MHSIAKLTEKAERKEDNSDHNERCEGEGEGEAKAGTVKSKLSPWFGLRLC